MRFSPAVSLQTKFKHTQTGTDICNFLFFPFICSRWEHNLLCVLTVCVHWYFAVKSERKPKHFLLLLLLSLLCKLHFCRGMKGSGKGAEQRIAWTGQCSLLAYFGCFYFRFLAMGISLAPLADWQQNPRLPHLVLTVTADAVTCLPGCCLWGGSAEGKRRIKADRGYNLEMRDTEARIPEEDCDKVLLESSFAQGLPGRVRSWETWLPFPTRSVCCVTSHNFTALR